MKGWQKFQGPRIFQGLGVALGETPVTLRLRPRDSIRVLTVVFGLMLPVGMMESADAQSTYTDITNHWARTCIETLAERDILSVFSAETFRPEDPIQRVEFASVVRQAFPNVEPVRDPIEFIDIPTDYWGREIVQDAYRRGFISPYSGRIFNPTQVIPRWQAIALLTTGLRYKSPENGLETIETSLADWEGIPDYARGAIAAGIQNRLVVNYPDPRSLNPTEPISRGELASMICQVQEDIGAIALVPQQYVASPDAIATAETPPVETPPVETPPVETPPVETRRNTNRRNTPCRNTTCRNTHGNACNPSDADRRWESTVANCCLDQCFELPTYGNHPGFPGGTMRYGYHRNPSM